MPSSSNDVTYLAPYTGSVSRILTGKLADVVSPEDFGAATDDALAVEAALASGRNVR
ncbi:hypothetical protein P7L78_13855 [Tistrella bauzanensis]|uniref:Uncharacterized protein n=1 Tax=Tistrella arctica TaxID=3133430 RepID=A0ABU9YHM0_9PROT